MEILKHYIFLFSIILMPSLAQAQQQNNESLCFNVAITNSFSWTQYDIEQTPDKRQPFGFNIDLWQQMEQDLRLCSNWQYNDDMKQVILSVQNNQADIGLVNFPTDSVLQLGLQTATVKEYTVTHIIKKVLSELTATLSWRILWIAISVLMIAALIRWIVDRFQPEEYRRFQRNFFKESLRLLWWNVNLIVNWEGFDTSRGAALLFDFAWHISGMILLGTLLSVLTVSFSLAASGNQIHKQEDVDGKTVAILQNADYVKHYLKQRDRNTKLVEVDNLEQAFELLITFKVDAVVHQSVELNNFFDQFYNEKQNIRLLPSIVNYQQYGVIISPDNAYKNAILELLDKYNRSHGLEASLIERLSNKWRISLSD